MDITIYQINMGRDHNRIAFEGLDLLKMYQGSDKIDSRIYDRVFEGEVDCKDLEDVYRKFNLEHPEGYKGRSLSVSDVVEIVDENGDSTFHFCDSIGFKQIDFDPYLTEEYKEDKIKVVLCEPGKVARVAEISNTLADLQKTVKGDIEQFCPYEEAVAIIFNEEGKSASLRMNCLHSRRKQRKQECLSAPSSGILLQTKRLRKHCLLMFLTLSVPCVRPGTIWIRR